MDGLIALTVRPLYSFKYIRALDYTIIDVKHHSFTLTAIYFGDDGFNLAGMVELGWWEIGKFIIGKFCYFLENLHFCFLKV